MKKAVSLLLALALLFSLCGFSVAAEEIAGGTADSGTQIATPAEAETPEPASGGEVTGFRFDQLFAGLTLESYEKGKLKDLYFLIDTISKALDCTVLLPDGQKISALCTAVWNTDTLTLDVAGIYAVTATLSPPDGCTFGDGVRTQIVVPVQIVDPDGTAVLITSIEEWIPNGFAIAVPVNDPIETVANHVDLKDLRIEGMDENGAAQDSTVEWDFSTVDMDTPGLYQVSGTLLPPPGTAFAPELALPEPVLTVSVQTPGSPDINCYRRGRSALVFPWLLSEEQKGQLDQFQVWLAVDGVWSKLESGHSLTSDYLQISLTILSADHTYGLQVDYPGGQTGILSFTYDGTKLDSDYSEGDRDGGDTDGSKPPSITLPPPTLPDGGNQDGGDHSSGDGDNSGGTSGGGGGASTPTPTPTPEPTPNPEPAPSIPPIQSEQPVPPVPEQDKPVIAPVAPQTPTPEQTLFTEESGETTSRLSGVRLHTMAVGGETRFSKQGITVALSAKALETLSVADDSIFYIEIERRSDTEFSFSVAVDGVAVTALADTKIALPYAATDEASMLSLKDESGNTVATGSYDTQRKLAAFTVDAAGCYTIEEEAVPAAALPSAPTVVTKAPAAEPPAENGTAAMPLLLGAVCLLALGGVFLWNRREKR